jgi:hypothetical protein
MKPMFALLCAVALVVGCSDSRSLATGPTAVPGSGQIATAPTSHALSGVVTAAGVPVSGAEIAELETVFGDDCFNPRELGTTTTDGAGSYRLSNVNDSGATMWASWVRAYKPGYFTNFQRPRVSRDMTLDFALDPWVFIPLGAVVHGTVKAGDAFCYGNSYGVPGVCHRFALAIRSTGTLEVTLTWTNTRPDVVLDVVRPGGQPCALFSWPGASRHSLRLPVEAGSTYEIRVVDDGSASPLSYELTTTLL